MSAYTVLWLALVFVASNVDSRRHHQEYQSRQFWGYIKDKFKGTVEDRLSIDFRHFDNEQMILFPDVAFQSADNDQKWKVMLSGWRYEHHRTLDWLGYKFSGMAEKLIKQLLGDEAMAHLNGSLNRDRLKPFFADDESKELIRVQIGDKTHSVYTGGDGKFREQVEVANSVIQKLKQEQKSNEAVLYKAIGDNKDEATGVIQLIEPRQGVSVISDIDDTIKVSEVLDKIRLIGNTFIHPFEAVPGMAELYQKWYAQNPHCTFHYLSGMPDQLYILTQEFINSKNFPAGSFHMRHFGWAAASLFDFLHSQSTFNHKISYLQFFIANTARDFVLVGDSGEKDPEIYGTIAREHPNRIRAIFIRAIKGEAFNDNRFLTAFQGVAAEKWQVFKDPSQLPTDLSRPPKAAASAAAKKQKRVHFHELFE